MILVLLLAAAGLAVLVIGHRQPQDVPWAPLDLGDSIGLFTGRKLTALNRDPALCRAVLDRAGIAYVRLPDRDDGPTCGYRDGVRVATTGPLLIRYRPPVGISCAVAAGLATWEWQVVQPAALRHFGTRVTQIEDFGSYNCRRIGGGARPAARSGWSEHASANAIDIAGFRLADGRRIRVAADWRGTGSKAAFLRDVRDGACDLFATTLSPDYNAAHRDHLHLDQADRGAAGWRACR
ncbi:MAG TPA: extensin family protein [Sphingomonas sp.]